MGYKVHHQPGGFVSFLFPFSPTVLNMLLIKVLSVLAFVAVEKAAATIFYAGVAESSGEFGVWSMCIMFTKPVKIISGEPHIKQGTESNML